ncbi:MAG: diguanylate cyclase, partial [Candidatus Brocadiales bacterium]
MSPFRSIKGKLLIFSLCISLIPIAVITNVYYLNARSALRRQIMQDMTAIAESKKAHVIEFLEAKRGRTVDFSSDGFIRDSLEKINLGEFPKQDNVIALNRHLLRNKKPLDPYIEGIEVVDMDGRVVAATHGTLIGQDISVKNVAFRRARDKGYTETCFGQPHYTPYLDADTICIATPITTRRGVDTIGMILNHYNMAFLNKITANRAGMGDTGEVVLGQRKGDDIVFLNSLLYAPDAPLNLSVPFDSTQAEPIRLALEGGSEAVIAPDYRDVNVVAAYEYIPSMDWGLVAKIDESEAFAPLKWLSMVALIVGLVSAAAVTSIALFFAFSFSRPINRLRDATDRFAAGDLKARAKITRRDEIGKLARSFDNMAGELESEITARERREVELRKLSLVVEQSPNLVVITDAEGRIEYVNPRFTQVTGYTPEEVVEQNLRILQSGKVSQREYKDLWETITSGGNWHGVFCNRKKNGELYWESKFISPTRNDEGTITHFISVSEDVTERKRAEKTMHQMAYYDPVTGLPNRTLFNDRLGVAITQAHRRKEKLAVMFLDLDQFKVINDTLGHGVGDLLLKAVGERLKRCLREGDTVARQGG